MCNFSFFMLDPTQVLRLFFSTQLELQLMQHRKLMSYICRLFITDSINKINFTLELVISPFFWLLDSARPKH